MISIDRDSVLSKLPAFKVNYMGFSVNRAEQFIDSHKLFEYVGKIQCCR